MIDMKVLTYAPNSTIPPFEDENAYWVEAGLEEFMDLIYPLLLVDTPIKKPVVAGP
jgi:hypothetical protein